MYLNADEIEAEVKKCGFLDLHGFGIETTAEEMLPFFLESGLLNQHGRVAMAKKLSFEHHRLHFPDGKMDSYMASVAAAFLRMKLLQAQMNFTFEMVMSHPSKVDMLKQA